MGLSRRVDVRLDSDLLEQLDAFACASGLARAGAARLLLMRGLSDADRPASVITPAQLAALVAAEHAVLMVASILPEGEQRMRALAARAAQSAEERLAVLTAQLAVPEEGGQ